MLNKSYSAARSILIQEVARYRGISPPPSLVGDRSRDAGGRMKRRKEGEGRRDVARVGHGALPGESTYISLVG